LSTEYLSNGCEALFGHKATNLLEKPDFSLTDLVHPDDRRRVRNTIQTALVEKKSYEFTYRILTAQKEEKWVWEKGSGIVDASEKVIALEGFITDITEQKYAEDALKENEKFLSSIIENIPNMIFIKDAQELKFMRLNKAGEELLGLNREDLIGKNDYDFFPREQADFFTQKDRNTLTSGHACDIPEEPIDTKTGRRILHTKKIPILDESGEPKLLLGISEDITRGKQEEKEREKLQAQLVQAQKMESVGRLAGGVAHDFNNMLGVILGYSELALEDLDPENPIFESLVQINKAAEHSAELTKQLLAFARKQTVIPKVLDLNETVEGMLKMLRRLIGEDINLVWHPGTGIHPIKIDPSQIDQILANLCVNARDAITDVGQITIETSQVTFDQSDTIDHFGCAPGDYARLSVTDSGCGMTEETLESVFEPFYTTKEHGKGTGLGLATVYGIVSQNNGCVNVYSEPGMGSTFNIYIPSRKTGQKAAPGKSEKANVPRGNETILLVEDEPAILRISRLMLEKLGYTVLSAPLPGEALDLAGKHEGEIHMLMTDVIMPEMNGKDLADKLVASCPGIKCLFASGYTGDIIAHHGMLGDDVNFIKKPFTKELLAVKLREVFDDA
jgi:PAS domain S-box-containing protein